MLPANIHNLQPAVGADLSFHPVQMVLHRLFGQREMIRYFLVGQSAREQRDQLLFPSRQSQVPMQRRRWKRFRFLREVPEKHCAVAALANCSPVQHDPHGIRDFRAAQIQRKNPPYSRSDVKQKIRIVGWPGQ